MSEVREKLLRDRAQLLSELRITSKRLSKAVAGVRHEIGVRHDAERGVIAKV